MIRTEEKGRFARENSLVENRFYISQWQSIRYVPACMQPLFLQFMMIQDDLMQGDVMIQGDLMDDHLITFFLIYLL
jgi:hypothetical protein